MKCPRCGHEMTLDTHRKYALNMCYECGYIEGRLIDPEKKGETNFERMKKLNFQRNGRVPDQGSESGRGQAGRLAGRRGQVTRTTVFCTPRPIPGAACFFMEVGKQIDASDKDSSNFSTFFGECVP